MTAKSRLLQYLVAKGLEKSDFYRDTGLSNGFLDKGEGINSDKLAVIVSRYVDINLMWLVTGVGEMTAQNRPTALPFTKLSETALRQIPIVDAKASAGSAYIFDEPDNLRQLDHFGVPAHMFRGGNLLSIQVRGDSMLPTLRPGDFVIGRQVDTLNEVRNGEVYIVIYQMDGSPAFTVKRCTYYIGDSDLIMNGDNDSTRNRTIAVTDLLKLFHVTARFTTHIAEADSILADHIDQLEKRLKVIEGKS